MKVFVVSDLEGVSGVTKGGQTTRWRADVRGEPPPLHGGDQRRRPRRQDRGGDGDRRRWTATGRARSGTSTRSMPELLDEACDFVVQDEWTEYTAFLESGVDAALFVGMHAMAGTRLGVMNHTVSGQVWQNLWFNGVLVGETGINAALCGTWGCPVLMVTRRRRGLQRGARPARAVARHRRRQAGARRPVGPQHRAAAGAGDDRGRRAHGRSPISEPSSPICPAAPARSRSSTRTRRRPMRCATGPASSGSATA